MKYKTRGNSNPSRKAKVYFCCHPDDFKGFFESITDEILAYNDCAIWYDDDENSLRDELFYSELKQMVLFVMPVTSRLLTKKCRAMDEDFRFALENHIPVLPLMQESGLNAEYKQKFGDLQFLSKDRTDSTEISYEEKLKKYLTSVLLDDETIKKVQAAFDAYIFLSYRKKDRIHAQELMRLIHKNDFCRDIAIWYDEFLTPGEDFNKTIREALEKSGLFVLAVTPSLLEPRIDENGVEQPNYIEKEEYPLAKNSGKPILPAEMVETDKDELARKYADIPSCTDAHDDKVLSGALLERLENIAKRENDKNPEHNFFIGLAYLNGIDVEVDHERAVELITFAAENNVPEAMDKLIEMYTTGFAVERDFNTAILWHEKKIDHFQRVYDEKPNEDSFNDLFWAITLCGDAYKNIAKLDNAIEKYNLGLSVCDNNVKENTTLKHNIAASYDRLGHIYFVKGNPNAAKDYYERCLSISEALAEKTDSAEARRNLAICYNNLGDVYKALGDLNTAREYYKKNLEISKTLSENSSTAEPRRALALIYGKLGDVYMSEGRPENAKEYYEKYFEISKSLADETNTAEARRDLTVAYERLGDIHKSLNDFGTATEYYQKCYETAKKLAADTDTIEARRGLALIYGKLGELYEGQDELNTAKEYYEKYFEISKALAEETNLLSVRGDLAIGYGKLGNIFKALGDLDTATKYFKKDLEISKAIADETNTLEAFFDFAISCGKLGSIFEEQGELSSATECYEKSLAIFKAFSEKSNTLKIRRNLFISLSKLGDVYRSMGKLASSNEYYKEALGIAKTLADESGSPESWLDLAVSYIKAAFIPADAAKEYIPRAMEIMTMLCEKYPDVAIYREYREIIQEILNSL